MSVQTITCLLESGTGAGKRAQIPSSIARGEAKTYEGTVVDRAGAAVDLTAYELVGARFIRRDGTELANVASEDFADDGTFTIELHSVMTKDWARQVGQWVVYAKETSDGDFIPLMYASEFTITDEAMDPDSVPQVPLTFAYRPVVNFRGAYDDLTTYHANDGVTYPDPTGGGTALSLFVALQTTTGVPPLDTNGDLNPGWDILVQRGPQGTIAVVTRTIVQPDDGQNFRVAFTSPILEPYAINPVFVSDDYTSISIPNGPGDRATDSFRVKTLGLLPNGAEIDFHVIRRPS